MKGNTIVIEDSSISLMHAKITRKNGDFLLKDLNSTNGTVVNGQPVGEVSLRDLDRVRFADISCQFLADAVPAEQPAPAAAAPAPVRPAVLQPAPPAPAIAAGPTAKPSQARSPKRSSLSALRYAGAGLAVTVVSLVGWRFFQLNQESSRKSDAAPTATLAATPKALTEGKAQTLTPKQGKSSPEPASKLSDEISQAPNNEPQISGILAEHKAESATEGIPQLVEALKSQDVAERQRAAAALHSLGAEAKEGIPALREALKDKDQDVQMWAALALVNNQEFDKRVVPVLVRVLQNDNPVLRQVACLSLGLIPYLESEKESVVPALAETAGKDANDDVRKAALSALSIIAPETVGKTALK
jgi:pSer/pThr/pTyr-binding forkhead associated (FHA) protein